MLLFRRVSIDPDLKHGISALYNTAYYYNDLRFIKPLIEAGYTVDPRK